VWAIKNPFRGLGLSPYVIAVKSVCKAYLEALVSEEIEASSTSAFADISLTISALV
jgi:hypothetical protein